MSYAVLPATADAAQRRYEEWDIKCCTFEEFRGSYTHQMHRSTFCGECCWPVFKKQMREQGRCNWLVYNASDPADLGMPLKVWGVRLRTLRIQRDLRQDEIAKRAILSASHIRKLEHGQFVPTRATLKRLASAFGVTEEYLAGQRQEEEAV